MIAPLDRSLVLFLTGLVLVPRSGIRYWVIGLEIEAANGISFLLLDISLYTWTFSSILSLFLVLTSFVMLSFLMMFLLHEILETASSEFLGRGLKNVFFVYFRVFYTICIDFL